MYIVRFLIFSISSFSVLNSCTNIGKTTKPITPDSVLKIEMHLSAFGVERSGFPTILARVDLTTNSSSCQTSYYEPYFKDSSYSLTKLEIDTVRNLLKKTDLLKLVKEYKVGMTDQATSTTTIFMTNDTIKIKDYGLNGDSPLPDLYRIIYKLQLNLR